MKNSNDTIGNRTRDFPACSAVPQTTEPPRAPLLMAGKKYFYGSFYGAVYISDRDMNPIFFGNKFQNIKLEYLANVVKIRVTIHRKTNVNKDNLIRIL
jgi:hypothetical protein